MTPTPESIARLSEPRERLQQAWDVVDTLPPIDFTEAEATALLALLERSQND